MDIHVARGDGLVDDEGFPQGREVEGKQEPPDKTIEGKGACKNEGEEKQSGGKAATEQGDDGFLTTDTEPPCDAGGMGKPPGIAQESVEQDGKGDLPGLRRPHGRRGTGG